MWYEELRKAIKLIGTQKKLSALLGVGCSVANNWLNIGIKIPLKYALHIEAMTNGLVKAKNLVPDAEKQLVLYEKYLIEKYCKVKGDS